MSWPRMVECWQLHGQPLQAVQRPNSGCGINHHTQQPGMAEGKCCRGRGETSHQHQIKYCLLLTTFCTCHFECFSCLLQRFFPTWSSNPISTTSQVSSGGPDDHCVVLLMSCPTTGIMSAAYKALMISYIANVMSDFRLNGICLLIHPNRAGQERTSFSPNSLRNVWGIYCFKVPMVLSQTMKP